jgi:hypothetical protein
MPGGREFPMGLVKQTVINYVTARLARFGDAAGALAEHAQKHGITALGAQAAAIYRTRNTRIGCSVGPASSDATAGTDS